jgi:hypothetical protein
LAGYVILGGFKVYTFEGREYIERDSVKAKALENYRARLEFGDSCEDAIQAAYKQGLDEDKALDAKEALDT